MISGDYPQRIKQGVKNTKLPLDQAVIWNQLEAKMQKKRKRKIIAFIPLAVLSAVFVFSFWSEYFTRQPTKKDIHSFNSPVNVFKNQPTVTVLFTKKDAGLSNNNSYKQTKPENAIQEVQSRKAKAQAEERGIAFLQSEIQKEMYPVAKDTGLARHEKIHAVDKIFSTPVFLSNKKFESSLQVTPGVHSVNQQGMRPFGSVYAGIGYVTKRFSGQRGESDEKIRQIRETETALEQKMAGISFTYPMYRKLFVSTGVDYRECTDKFQFSKVEKEEIDQLDYYQSYRVKETILTRYNANRFLDVHVDAGYVFQMSGCKILPTIGLSYSLISSFEGTITSETNDPLYINQTTITPNIWNARFGTQVQFVLFSDMHLSLSPLVMTGLNVAPRHEAGVSQSFSTFSFMVGLTKALP